MLAELVLLAEDAAAAVRPRSTASAELLDRFVPGWHRFRGLYTLADVEACLRKVRPCAYNEPFALGHLTATPLSSGFCLGAANWEITSTPQTGFRHANGQGEMRIVHVGASSSTASRHPQPLDFEALRAADVLLLSQMRVGASGPDAELTRFLAHVAQTLGRGGNVLVPIMPAGVLFDLIETLPGYLSQTGDSTVANARMYVASPVAAHCLAFANINAEWLAARKVEHALNADAPFAFGALKDAERLFTVADAGPALDAVLKQPAIVFAGHTSLRVGPVVDLIRRWGDNARNSLILVDSEYDHVGALAPFLPMAMQVVRCAIDTRLTTGEANNLVAAVRPKCVVTARRFGEPTVISEPIRGEHELHLLTPGQEVRIDGLEQRYMSAYFAPELASTLRPTVIDRATGEAVPHGAAAPASSRTADTVTVAPFRAVLNLHGRDGGDADVDGIVLQPEPVGIVQGPAADARRRFTWGLPRAGVILARLREEGLADGASTTTSDGDGEPSVTVTVPALGGASVVITPSRTRIHASGDREREVLKSLVLEQLYEL